MNKFLSLDVLLDSSGIGEAPIMAKIVIRMSDIISVTPNMYGEYFIKVSDGDSFRMFMMPSGFCPDTFYSYLNNKLD
jgi:hypothetical protein